MPMTTSNGIARAAHDRAQMLRAELRSIDEAANADNRQLTAAEQARVDELQPALRAEDEYFDV